MFELFSVNVVSLIFKTLLFVGFVAVNESAKFNLMINTPVLMMII